MPSELQSTIASVRLFYNSSVHGQCPYPRACFEGCPPFPFPPHSLWFSTWCPPHRALLSPCLGWRALPCVLLPSSPTWSSRFTRGGLCLRYMVTGICVGTFGGKETVTECSQLRGIVLQAREAINHFNLCASFKSSPPFLSFFFFFFPTLQHDTVPAVQ